MSRSVVLALLVLLAACESDDAGRPPLTSAELMDPESCKGCHARTFTEWSASMHAYAVEDPVFKAMNAQAQDAGLGDFCVSCHAPMAVREGAFANGDFNDFEQVPDHLEGVTCFFCHTTVDVERDHNNGLVLAREDSNDDNDDILWGGIADPVQPYAHRAAASKFFDRTRPESNQMCGSCHDIVVPGTDFHLERTYEEYLSSVYTQDTGGQACIDCHMDPSTNKEVVADYEGVQLRWRQSHLFPGVDVPLTPFPGREAMVSAVERHMLPSSISYFSVVPDISLGFFRFTVALETMAGHRMPSGAAQDRRMWLEWIAFDAEDQVIAESGTIDDDEVEVGHDPQLWLMRDILFDEDGEETHVFWEAASRNDAELLPVPTSLQVGAHTLERTFDLEMKTGMLPPARIELRLRMRPIGLDVLQELVDAGDLDQTVLAEMPTFTVYQATAEWPEPENPNLVNVRIEQLADPSDHLCKLFPEDRGCD